MRLYELVLFGKLQFQKDKHFEWFGTSPEHGKMNYINQQGS